MCSCFAIPLCVCEIQKFFFFFRLLHKFIYFLFFLICVKVFWFFIHYKKKTKEKEIKNMAVFNEFSRRHIMQFLIILFVLTCVRANQRRFSPLLVEDDGARNNRPAGMVFCFGKLFKFKEIFFFVNFSFRLIVYCTFFCICS